MFKWRPYIVFVILIAFGGVSGCAAIDGYIGDTEEKVSEAKVKFEKVISLYEDKIRPQAKEFIDRADRDYKLYFGSDIEALESDNGIQDIVYNQYWDKLDEDQKENLTELNEKIKKSYDEYKELRKKAIELDKTIQEKKKDVDEFFKTVNKVLDKMKELNDKAKTASNSVKKVTSILTG